MGNRIRDIPEYPTGGGNRYPSIPAKGWFPK